MSALRRKNEESELARKAREFDIESILPPVRRSK